MTQSWRYVGLLSILGCHADEGMRVEVPITQPPEPPNCTAFVSWKPPTERVPDANGVSQEFTVEEISRWDLFIGLDSGEYYRVVGILDRYLTNWEEAELQGGDNYFTMTVTDNGGLESDKADEIVKFVDTRCSGE